MSVTYGIFRLVMVHGVDGQKAEKFYVGGSVLLASVLGLLSYSTKQWTYNAPLEICWIDDRNPVKRTIWLVGITLGGWSAPLERATLKALLDRESTPVESVNYDRGVDCVFLCPHVHDSPQTRLVYLSRGSIYALVAAVDPAFSRAFKALYRHYLRRSVPSRSTNSVGFAATSEGLHSAGSLGMLAPRTEETELREIDPMPKHGNTFGPSSALEVSREFPLPKPEPAMSASSRRARYEYPPDRSYVIPEESFGRSLEESRGYRSYCSHHSYHSDLEKSL
ncbi:hypothetical protein PM082_010032 [Marasmius tenuissimus]|nr:hypothetical protein PM082_010032 [Marasmius tenuissimus]